MQLDRFFIFVSLSFLPMLWLPLEGLTYALWACAFLIVVGVGVGVFYRHCFYRHCFYRYCFYRHCGIFCLGFIALISYAQIFSIAKNAENQTAFKSSQTVEIVQILKQREYQTAIGKLMNEQHIYLSWQSETPLLLHQKYQIELNLRPLSGRKNIGNFDRQRWYFANHIEGIATVRKAQLLPTESTPFRTKWLKMAYQQTEALPSQGLLLALAFGERAWLKNSDWQIFQQTATAHLIAISGLHIALAMGFGFWLARLGQGGLLFWLHKQKADIRCLHRLGLSYLFPRLIGFGFALGYSYLAGFAIPTVRALFAICFVLGCQLLRRHYTSGQLWWRVVAVLLILDPLAVLSDSFWLSILAVACLILWYRYFPLRHFLSHWANAEIIARITQHRLISQLVQQRFFKGILSLLHLQLGFLLLFAPAQFFFFEGNSPHSFLANLLIVPYYSFLLVPVILFTLLTNDLFSTWVIADQLAQGSLWLLGFFSEGWITFDLWEQWQLITLCGGILWIWHCKSEKRSGWFLFNGVIGLILFNLAFYLTKWNEPKAEWITFDVGQGLAQAVVYRETSGQKRAIFYDTGNSWGEGDQRNSMAKLEIIPYLKRQGIVPEAIFVSHDDNDHSGGVVDLLAEYPDTRLISSSQTAYLGKVPEACLAGKQWQFGDVQNGILIESVFPDERVGRAKNAHSCILIVKIDRLRLLFTGDIGVSQEQLFAHQVGKVDFLQIAHHGSKTSTSETLLSLTQPQLAVVSTGRWNPWKMPNKTVVERLKKREIPLLDTAKVGMIRVKFFPENHNNATPNWRVKTARDRYSPWFRGYLGKSALSSDLTSASTSTSASASSSK